MYPCRISIAVDWVTLTLILKHILSLPMNQVEQILEIAFKFLSVHYHFLCSEAFFLRL